MTRNRKDDREALARLAAMLADDLLDSSDEEFVAELLEEGRNPTQEAEAMRAMIERAARGWGKARLAAAKAQIAVARPGASQKQAPPDTRDARRKLAALLAQDSARGLSMAARNESEMSDDDVFGMLADLEELGIADEKSSDSES